jgi:hypothetical protein
MVLRLAKLLVFVGGAIIGAAAFAIEPRDVVVA